MVLRFASGSVTPASALEEAVAFVGVDQGDVVVVAEEGDDLLGLAGAHQPGVDEDAGELVADRLVDQHRGDRAVDAAGEAADHPLAADPGADVGDRLVAVGGHGPVADEAREVGEVLQQARAVDGVVDLGVELHGVEAARRVADDGEGGVRRGGEDLEARRQRGDAVAVAHPDLLAAGEEEAVEERVAGVAGGGEIGAAELGVVAALDPAAERVHHRLLAVADAEHRHAEREDLGVGAGAAGVGDAGGAAGEDDRLRAEGGEEGGGHAVEGVDLAVDARLAQPAGDQLGDLAAEIDDEQALVRGLGHRLRIGRGVPLRKGALRASEGCFQA